MNTKQNAIQPATPFYSEEKEAFIEPLVKRGAYNPYPAIGDDEMEEYLHSHQGRHINFCPFLRMDEEGALKKRTWNRVDFLDIVYNRQLYITYCEDAIIYNEVNDTITVNLNHPDVLNYLLLLYYYAHFNIKARESNLNKIGDHFHYHLKKGLKLT